MNEHIDLAFVGAKIAAHNNEAASTAILGVSALYNVGQMARYRAMYYQQQYAILNGGPAALASLMEQYRSEMWKHTVLASVDLLSLFIRGFQGVRSTHTSR